MKCEFISANSGLSIDAIPSFDLVIRKTRTTRLAFEASDGSGEVSLRISDQSVDGISFLVHCRWRHPELALDLDGTTPNAKKLLRFGSPAFAASLEACDRFGTCLIALQLLHVALSTVGNLKTILPHKPGYKFDSSITLAHVLGQCSTLAL